MSTYQTVLFSLGTAALLTVSVTSSATAQVTFFDNRALFEAASEQLSTEGFETPFATGSSVEFSTFSIEELSPQAELRRSTAATFATAGFASLEYFSDGPSTIKITFDEPTTAFAIDLISFGNASGGDLMITDNGSMTSPEVVAVAPPSLMPLNLLFVGYVSPGAPFTEVMLTTSTSGDTIAMDEMSFGKALAVPEPSTIVLALFSIGMLGMIGRRKRKLLRA